MKYFNLGSYTKPITTSSPTAQIWFDRGLVWTYAFNHEEAIVCFQKAIETDPECALAHWGIAYAIGPNYNKPWEAFETEEKSDVLKLAHASMERAMATREAATPLERALIDALSLRYPADPEIEDFGPWSDGYANAMRDVYRFHPRDLDVCCLFAEALMNRTPWQLWDLSTGQPAEGADTAEATDVLETALDSLVGAWDHPGLLHIQATHPGIPEAGNVYGRPYDHLPSRRPARRETHECLCW